MNRSIWILGVVALSFGILGCNGAVGPGGGSDAAVNQDQPPIASEEASGRKGGNPWVRPSPSPSPTTSPVPTPSPTPAPSYAVDALIYNGVGANASDVQSIIGIIQSHGLSYGLADSSRLNSMTVSDLSRYGTILWPGGNSNDADAAFTSDTRLRVRQAVYGGMNFTGFCAGAWIAVGPDPGSRAPVWGFAIVTGSYLKEYFPNGQEPTAAIVPTSFVNGVVRDLLWWAGPYLPDIPGGVIAKYADGVPAIVQAWAGKGFVTISGPHPEAPQSWRDSVGLVDPDGLDYDIAWNMIQAGLKKYPMLAF